MKLIIKLLIVAASAFVLQSVLSGVHIASFGTAVIFAIILGLLDITIKPILKILGFPLTIITLGLFSLVINACIILLAEYLVDGVTIDSFWWALGFSIALSVVTSILSSLFLSKK
ncbi:phage holin family protein [Riemerella anatipestifer]|uniref:phage holin family protein n=1 Tax=Riemerella anatipestifer TaxID=34085 RepID=UPI00129EBC43|nr:phage holin family protein [Riemerella anatipestifer]MBO4233155.1 phage holin family protein [Riemerella anatipestifer]MRM83976.1 phage holin family protein [Riemerella anatipestifer]